MNNNNPIMKFLKQVVRGGQAPKKIKGRVVHTGPRGGKYVKHNGTKHYV